MNKGFFSDMTHFVTENDKNDTKTQSVTSALTSHSAFFHIFFTSSRKSRRYWEGVTPSDFLNTLVNTR